MTTNPIEGSITKTGGALVFVMAVPIISVLVEWEAGREYLVHFFSLLVRAVQRGASELSLR